MICGDGWVTVICEPDFRFPAALCLGPQGLDCRHHIGMLVVIGLAELRGPGEVLSHVRQHGGKLSERFHAWIPDLLIDGGHQRAAGKRLVLAQASNRPRRSDQGR